MRTTAFLARIVLAAALASVSGLTLAQAPVKYDVHIEADKIEVRNVKDWDGTEDVYGFIEFFRWEVDPAFGKLSGNPRQKLWQLPKGNFVSRRSGEAIRMDSSYEVVKNLTLDQLKNLSLYVQAYLEDNESPGDPRKFYCSLDCNMDVGTGFGGRRILFAEMPTTQKSIADLQNNGQQQFLKFGNDTNFEMNFYENHNKNDGWLKVLFRVKVRPHN